MQTMKKEIEFVSAESSACLQSSPCGSNSGNVKCCPHLSLGSLLDATSGPQSVAISFRLGCIWDGPSYSTLLVFHQHKAQGCVIQHLKAPQLPPPLPLSAVLTLVLASLLTHLFLRGLLVQLGEWDTWIPPERCCSSFREDCRCIPLPCTTCLVLSQIISTKV